MPSSSRISIKKLPLAAQQHSQRQNGLILTHRLVRTALESNAAWHHHIQPDPSFSLHGFCFLGVTHTSKHGVQGIGNLQPALGSDSIEILSKTHFVTSSVLQALGFRDYEFML